MITHIDSKSAKQLSITKSINPTRGFIKLTPFVTFYNFYSIKLQAFCHNAFSTVQYHPCDLYYNVPIIADEVHLFKVVDVQQDLWETRVETFSVCFETSKKISIEYR